MIISHQYNLRELINILFVYFIRHPTHHFYMGIQYAIISIIQPLIYYIKPPQEVRLEAVNKIFSNYCVYTCSTLLNFISFNS